jgi:tRNA A-37 threonylcarbamoyl transferase component Bud32
VIPGVRNTGRIPFRSTQHERIEVNPLTLSFVEGRICHFPDGNEIVEMRPVRTAERCGLHLGLESSTIVQGVMGPPYAVIGPYRLARKLGEGGMGEVYEAVHETLERQVAIKLLRPEYARDKEATRRFFNEARATNRIKHPGLVQVSDFGQLQDGTSYIVMEYLSGETLGRRLKRLPGRLPLPQILHISWQVASALAAAHQKGIIHRDLKPDNVMLVPDEVAPTGERAKLLDFGLAKLARDARDHAVATRSNVLMGTPTYMSPEQCRGAGVVDEKSDVYSLGVMLYQMIGGRPPFVAEGVGEIISGHLSAEPLQLLELAPQTLTELLQLVHKLLSKDRKQRPAMQEVVVELEQLEARQGSAGTRRSAEIALESGAAASGQVKFKGLLAAALAAEPEAEDLSTSSESGSAGQAMLYEPTLSSDPHAEPKDFPLDKQRPSEGGAASALSLLLNAPTMVSQPLGTSDAKGEVAPATSSVSRRRLVLASLVVGLGTIAGVSLLRPSQPAPVVKVLSATPVSLPPPRTSEPSLASIPPKGDLPPENKGPLTPPPVVSQAAPQPQPDSGYSPGQPQRVLKAPAPIPQTRAVRNRNRNPARPKEGMPTDVPRQSAFKIID